MSGRHRTLAIAAPFAWMLTFFVAPLAIVLKISFSESTAERPPYAPLFEMGTDGGIAFQPSVSAYLLLLSDSLYFYAFLGSLRIAAVSTFVCLLIGLPMAYAIARSRPERRNLLVLLVMLPFWTSFLIRVYAWMALLKPTGILNNVLISLGLVDEPLPLMNNDFAVHLGIVYSYLPFMVLPIYAALEKMDWTLVEAAADLGCRPLRTFFAVTTPLCWHGIAAGSLLVFIPAAGEFVIPDLLGGPDTLMVGRVLWTEFFINRDWPAAAALTIAMLSVLLLPILAFQRMGVDTDRP